MDYTQTIASRTVEYIDSEHLYLVDGVVVPSITQILRVRFGGKYEGIAPEVLNEAARRGTEVHEAVERYCKTGEESDLPELRGFKFLQRAYGFEVLQNEVPVILFMNDEPVAAGRLDLVLKIGNEIGGADIKRTAGLDKNYLAYQLNLYRIAYRQSYGIEWKFLKGVHLRNDVRRLVDIPVNEQIAIDLMKECFE